jgi:hypothetical protein
MGFHGAAAQCETLVIVSFFEPPRPPPELPEQAFERKPWWGAPTNELGVSTGLRLVLARTDDVVIALIDVIAYSEGVEFTLSVLRRSPAAEPGPFDHPFGMFMPGRKAGEELPRDLLRFGVQFADGRKATTTGGPAMLEDSDPPASPVLSQSSGGGGGARWDQSFWLWPLPTPGPVSFVVEWLSEGIELTRHELDAAPIIDASRGSETLWPEPPDDGGWISSEQLTQ